MGEFVVILFEWLVNLAYLSRVLQHRVKVALFTAVLAVMVAAYYVDGPHQTVSDHSNHFIALFYLLNSHLS